MAAAKEITLKVNIDPSGAVSGAKAVTGGAAEATEAIKKINVSLGNLNSAYAVGRAAVDKYNTEMAVLDALERHNLDTKNKLGKELAESVRQNIALVAAVKANEQALRAQEAAERSALSAKIAKRRVQDESAVALYQEVQALKGLYAAYQGGEGAVDAYNKKMFVKNALLEAGRTLQSQEGQAVAADAAKHWDLTAAIAAAEKSIRQKAAAFEAAHAAALADNAAMDLAKQKTDAFVVSIQAEVARLQGLAAAYAGGRAGVAAFNLAEEIKNRQLQNGVSATSAAGKAIEQYTRQEYAARDAVNKLESALKEKEKELRKVKPAADNATQGISAFQTAIGTLATLALNRLKSEIIGARQSFDRMTNTFAVSSSSAGEAAEKMSFLRDNAQKLGLDIQSVGVSFAKFDVAAQNTSLSSNQVRDIFVSVSEATTAMGLSSEVAEGALLALQQMISKGTVQSEELRGQFAERIPGAFRLAAEAMGWTQLELAKNLEQGRVLSEDLLPKLAAKLHEVFGPGSVSGAKLLSAEINRLKNAWFDFLVNTSQSIRLPQLISALTSSFGALVESIKLLLALGFVLWLETGIAKLKLFKATLVESATAAKAFWSSIGGLVTIGIALIAEGTSLLYDQIKKSEKESDAAILRIIANTNEAKTQFDILRSLQDKLAGRNDQPVTPEERMAPKAGLDKAKADLKNVLDLIKELEKSKARLPGKVDESIEFDVGNLAKIEAVSKTGSKSLADLRVEAGVLSTVVEKANARFHWMTMEMDEVASSSKRAVEAEKTYQETLKQIQQDFDKGEFKRLGGIGDQLAEAERQRAEALKARQNATTPGLMKAEAKNMREAASAANAYQKEVDRMLKKYDEFNTAQKNFDDAMAMAEELYKAGEFGAYGSAEAQARLNEIQQNGANMLMDELSPGLRQANEEMAKLNIQMDNQLASNSKMLSAYKSGADAVDEQTRAIGIAAITEDILTKAKANSVTIDDGYIESTKRKAAAMYDSNIETELANKLYEDTSAIQNAIDQNEQYVIALNAGSEALMDVAAYQAAYNAIVKPGAKITAEMWLAIMKLTDANKELAKSQQDVSKTKIIDDLKYETEWMEKYAIALKGGQGELEKFNIQKQIADALKSGEIGKDDVIEFEAQLKASSLAKIKVDLAKITHDFKEGMWDALQGGLKTFLTELGEGNKDAVKNLGKNLQAAMLEAVAKWLSAMLIAIARAALASKAISGGSGTGGGGFMGSMASLFGGGGAGGGAGISTGAVALGAWVAVAAAAVAVLKHQVDRANAVRYQTTVSYNTSSDTMFTGGKLMETGGKIATAFKALLDEVQSATGALLEGAHKASIAVRNDKQGFRALIDGVVIGTFKTMDEAIVAAMKKLFSAENLKNSLDPIVQQVINNFDASKGPQEFANAIKAVTQIMNDLSGLTDIEIQLRDLPAQASQLVGQLHAMGVALTDAEAVAAQWTVNQYQSLRDQITGHQATAAEQRAEKERQAAYFNAQLAVSKANMAMMKAELEYKIANYKVQVEWSNKKYEFDLFKLTLQRDLIKTDMDLSQTELDIAQWRIGARDELTGQDMTIAENEINLRRATGQISLEMLRVQLEAINAAMAALDAIKPIDFSEIRIGNPGGNRGGSSGPDIIEEFWAFWEQKQRDAMSNVAGQIYDINKAYDEQVKAAIKLGMVEELEAARLAELARIRTDFLKSYTDDELSDYTRAVNELNEAFSDQALLDEYIGQEDELARVRHNAMMRLREDLLDSFDSPMEGTRDNLADLIARFRDLDEANRALSDDFQRGAMTAEEYADALEHSRQVQEEFNAQMAVSLLNMAVYFTDALGDETKSAEIRAKLAEFEYNLKLAEFELTLETAYAQHWINTELYMYLKDILEQARENPPDFYVPPTQQGGGNDSGSQSNPLEDMLQALLRALDRLRNILQSYTDFLMGLQNSDLSPYSIEQQYNTAQSEYERLLALAQAGDLNAMELLPEAAQTYLELAEQMFGTSSAGYNDIFQQINADMTEIMGSIQDILDQVPSQYQPIEQKLDTIAEILDNMYLLWMNFDTGDTGGGGGGWTPPGPTPTAPRTLQEFFEAYNLDWSQLSGGELMDVMNSVTSILADNQVSNVEMSDFVAAMEAMLGMDAGSMTQAQINALRTWLYQQVGNMDSNGGNNNAQGGDNGQNNATGGNKSGASLSNNYAAQMNKNLEIIASLTAKGLRDSSSERYKKPRLTYAGYVGSRSKPMRAS